jgi:histidinol-phosphatase (PHP family)
MRDYHVHTNYSDGFFLPHMLEAAEAAGLDAVGFADHCNVARRPAGHHARTRYGFNLDRTYDRRRDAIESIRDTTDLTVYDAVEMDYDPRDEPGIEAFLAEADFDYTIGSVHAVPNPSGAGDLNVQHVDGFAALDDDALDTVVDTYYDHLVALADSDLFDIAAHPDLLARNPHLRDRATHDHYRRAAAALADSQAVPEVNAGRVLRDDGHVHPRSDFQAVLRDHDVSLTVGTDSHRPGELADRADYLATHCADAGIDPAIPPALR